MKHCFWNNCSFREVKVSLTECGITRPSAVLGSGTSDSRAPPHAVDADVSYPGSLGSSGSDVPSAVNTAKSLLSFSRSYDSQLDKIINNSALQDLVSHAVSRSPALVPDAGGTTN